MIPPALGALVHGGTSPRPSGLPLDDFKIVTKYHLSSNPVQPLPSDGQLFGTILQVQQPLLQAKLRGSFTESSK